jgi:hypothetical protein
MNKLMLAAAVLLLPLTGCTLHITQDVAKRLDVSEMNRTFEVTPADLGARSKCQDRPSVSIVNLESRTDDFNAMQNPPFRGVINPKEMMDAVTSYLGDSYNLSQIRVRPTSTKVLQLKLVDLESTAGVWTFGSSFKTELTIPETGFQKIYEGSDNAASGYTAAADAIAAAARKIVDDPAVQDYLLCSASATGAATQPPSGETLSLKLQELGKAQEQGLITQEEYRLKRKELLEKY